MLEKCPFFLYYKTFKIYRDGITSLVQIDLVVASLICNYDATIMTVFITLYAHPFIKGHSMAEI